MIIVTGDIFRPDRDPTKCHQSHNIKWLEKKCKDSLSSEFKTIHPLNPLSLENWLLLDRKLPNPIMKDFIMPDDIVIGFELPRSVIAWLKQEEIMYVDIIISPIRFMPKRILGIETNIIDLKSIPEHEFYEYAKTYDNNINDNKPYSLIIGQTDIDRSLVDNNGILKKLDDYTDKFDFSKRYKFKPHPLQRSNIPEFVIKHNIEIIKDVDIYNLLWDNNLQEVVSISSSVTYEAKYFNTNAVRFIERELEKYIMVYEDEFFGKIIKQFK